MNMNYKNLEELRNTNGIAENNLFKAFGLDYIYQNEGNNIEKMIETFEKVKNDKLDLSLKLRAIPTNKILAAKVVSKLLGK